MVWTASARYSYYISNPNTNSAAFFSFCAAAAMSSALLINKSIAKTPVGWRTYYGYWHVLICTILYVHEYGLKVAIFAILTDTGYRTRKCSDLVFMVVVWFLFPLYCFFFVLLLMLFFSFLSMNFLTWVNIIYYPRLIVWTAGQTKSDITIINLK